MDKPSKVDAQKPLQSSKRDTAIYKTQPPTEEEMKLLKAKGVEVTTVILPPKPRQRVKLIVNKPGLGLRKQYIINVPARPPKDTTTTTTTTTATKSDTPRTTVKRLKLIVNKPGPPERNEYIFTVPARPSQIRYRLRRREVAQE